MNWDPARDLTGTTDDFIYWRGQLMPIIRGAQDPPPDSDEETPPGDENPDDTSDDKDDSKEGAKDKKFSQEDLSRVTAREVAKATRGKISPSELGFESTKDMKEWVDTQREKAKDDEEEGEKLLREAVEEAKKEARDDILSVANERILRAEFLLAAQQHDIRKGTGNDAYVLAQTLELWKEVEIDDEGKVEGFTDDFFEDLKKEKPFLFEVVEDEGGSSRGDIGAGRRGAGDKGEKDLTTKYPALTHTRW
jgi:hypothetical protein